MELKNQVIQDAQRQRQNKPKGQWLNDGIEFVQAVRLSEQDKETAEQIFNSFHFAGYKRKQKLTDFEILFANLLQNRDRRPVVISLDRNKWKNSPYTRTSYFTVEITKQLEEQGLIFMQKGYRTEKDSKKTRIWPTSLLLEHFPEKYHGVYVEPVNLVELKDEHGNLVNYKDTQFTSRIKKVLSKVNEVNQQARIEYKGFRIYNPLVAVFQKKFTLYGRLHTRGYRHFQGMSEDQRLGVKINDESVVELDYSGLHPRLLYAAEGVQFNEDPYSVVFDDFRARPFLKAILLYMLNAKDWTQAERAANNWLYKNHSERATLKKIGITRARPIMEAFFEAHKPIAGYFCKGKETGLHTMNKDARIALDVVNHFAKQGKPIMPVHDSFVVQARYKDELLQVMNQVYQKHTNFTCPIKES